MRTILFLCSGHLCRGRFAEFLFNHRATENQLEWQAESRGLVVDWMEYEGGLSLDLIRALSDHDIDVSDSLSEPLQVCEKDLTEANIIVAVSEIEHRPIFRARFPDWEENVEFWDVQDLDVAVGTEPLQRIEQMVNHLVEDLCDVAVSG